MGIALHPKPDSFRRISEQDKDERAPGSVQDRLGEHTSRQAFDVQVFHGHQAVTVDQHTRRSVMEVAALLQGGIV